MSKLPDLEAWAIFAKVAEAGSFAKASTELGIGQATVSKAIGRLEARLKTALFHRTSRKMSLTESGRAALERAARILDEGEAVEAEVTAQSKNPRGRIRLACPMSFGVGHVAPALPKFMARYPEIALDIDFSDQQVDLVAGGFDLALRISSLADSTLLARRLCAVRILLVGSPRYFDTHGRPTHPREMATHRAMLYANAASEAWRFKHRRQGDFSIGVPSTLRVNNAEAVTPALLAGLGIALQPEFLVWDEVRTGKLEVVMADWAAPAVALHIVTPPSRARPVRVELLIEHFASSFGAAPWATEVTRSGRLKA